MSVFARIFALPQLSRNQITHIYSLKKNTEAMINGGFITRQMPHLTCNLFVVGRGLRANIEKAVLAMPLLSRISRTADGVNLWQAVGNWWQAGEWRVRLGLVPVGHGIKIVRAVVSAAVLDGGANRFGKSDWRLEVESVN
jgi:hypothetical protein